MHFLSCLSMRKFYKYKTLLTEQLKSGIVIAGTPVYPGKGVLQGGVLSGALANLYLSDFDRKCLRHGMNLVRYEIS
ncbi:hypothetical protein GTQ43_24545 [Nostoc sp. KVJ3]|uniref:hypothetical protein n=1 Tax=Nostoc sp. KVJ3 TaxID=457945 RepID=UPI0022378DF5|nr:hypothetical protein [Nostoc sp. KVJ3]MCW5316870.1 hypothetical protein [Nostoc sp. KVJ3]